MADIQVDLGHGRNAGASTKGDATLATLLVVVPAVFQQKTAYSLQNRRSAEVAQRRPKPQGPRGHESPTPSSQGSLRRWSGVVAGIADPSLSVADDRQVEVVIHVASCTSPRRPFDLFSRAALSECDASSHRFQSEQHFPKQCEEAHAFPKLRETD